MNTNIGFKYHKYSEKSLEFIYSEAEKHFKEITLSFREITNKSYILIGVLCSIMGVLISEIIKSETVFNIHGLLFLMLTLPTILICLNLFPVPFVISGAQPHLLKHTYFEKNRDAYKRLLVQRIEDIQLAIYQNGQILSRRSKRLRSSLLLVLLSLIASFIFWFLNS